MNYVTSPSAAVVQEYINAFDGQRGFGLCEAATCTWLGYDILLTFPEEVKFVWRRRWTIAKVCYLIARYYTLVNLIVFLTISTSMKPFAKETSVVCKSWVRLFASSSVIIPFAVDSLLVIRLYALYNKNKFILAILIVFWIGQPAAVTVTSFYTVNSMDFQDKPSSMFFPGCVISEPTKIRVSLAAWIIALFSQLVYFCLTLNKYFESIRTLGNIDGTGNRRTILQTVRHTRDFSPLVSLFIRDGTMNFFLLFAAMFANLAFTVIARGPLEQTGVPWVISAYGIIASRLYLNLGGYLYRTITPPLSSYYPRVRFPSMDSNLSEEAECSVRRSMNDGERERGAGNTPVPRDSVVADVEATSSGLVTGCNDDSAALCVQESPRSSADETSVSDNERS